jgi:hypothetical protein
VNEHLHSSFFIHPKVQVVGKDLKGVGSKATKRLRRKNHHSNHLTTSQLTRTPNTFHTPAQLLTLKTDETSMKTIAV